MQQSLFNEQEVIQETYSLRIKAKPKAVLSKDQIAFNKLTHRIEFLEKQIELENEKMLKLNILHTDKIVPFELKLAQKRLNIAFALDKSSTNFKFSAKQIENIRFVIIELCGSAFQSMIPNEEQKALYDKWSKDSYDDEIKAQEEFEGDTIKDFFSSMFGIDFDSNEAENNPDEFEERMKQKFEEHNTRQSSKTKKSTKQIEKEAARKAAEELMNKNIRSIYIALVKVLHPDSETDDTIKLEKEELMKIVTTAYEKNDIITMLRLEMEWVHKTSEHLDKLTEEKLKIYITALRNQVSELEKERFMLYRQPQYMNIFEYSSMAEKYAIAKILSKQKELKSVVKSMGTAVDLLITSNSKKTILDFVNEYKELMTDSYFDELPW